MTDAFLSPLVGSGNIGLQKPWCPSIIPEPWLRPCCLLTHAVAWILQIIIRLSKSCDLTLRTHSVHEVNRCTCNLKIAFEANNFLGRQETTRLQKHLEVIIDVWLIVKPQLQFSFNSCKHLKARLLERLLQKMMFLGLLITQH